MELGHLRTFVAIVDAGGVHRAAARLNYSQPAVSRDIHSLESELGVPLFDRIGRRVQLTSERGKTCSDGVLPSAGRCALDCSSEPAPSRMETPVSYAWERHRRCLKSSLANFLNRFHELYPRVEVQLIEDGGTALSARLERGHVVLALMAVDDERFEYRLLYPCIRVGCGFDCAQARPSSYR